jgi:hypothetical protein
MFLFCSHKVNPPFALQPQPPALFLAPKQQRKNLGDRLENKLKNEFNHGVPSLNGTAWAGSSAPCLLRRRRLIGAWLHRAGVC